MIKANKKNGHTHMSPDYINPPWRFWVFWTLAFLAFPIGGLLANVIVGPVTTAIPAAFAGAIAGAVLGMVQWVVLKAHLPLTIWWVIATSAGMALGLAISVALLGSEVTGNVILWRAAITGVVIGVAQWFLLWQTLSSAWIWIVATTVGWVVGWFITRSAGIDLNRMWPVFGASGAFAYQLLTGGHSIFCYVHHQE